MSTNDKHVERAALLREQAAGLLKLADLVEATPEIDANYLDTDRLSVNVWYSDSPSELVAVARAALQHGAKVDKEIVGGDIFSLEVSWGPLTAKALAQRDQVCERVVTGTETVTRTVPDPSVEVPMVEVTETVEKTEWRCGSLLAAEADAAVTA